MNWKHRIPAALLLAFAWSLVPVRLLFSAEPPRESNFLVAAVDPSDASPSRELKEFVDQYWSQFKAVDEKVPADADDETIDGHWIGVAQSCHKLFHEMLDSAKDERAVMEQFCAKFGADGPQADLRWLLCNGEWTIDMYGAGALHPQDTERNKQARRRQLLTAEMQTRYLLAKPAALDRYVECVAWSDFMLRPDSWKKFYIPFTERDFRNEGEYWWHARTFLVLARATNHTELLKDVNPEQLKPRFEEWLEWYWRAGPILRPNPAGIGWTIDEEAKMKGTRSKRFDFSLELPPLPNLPKAPFTDWKGTRPPSTGIFRKMCL